MNEILAAEVKSERFTSNQQSSLVERLAVLDQHTVLLPAVDIKDLLLDGPGKTQSGYRYNSWSFYQLCHCLASGLHLLVNDLTGDVNERKGVNYSGREGRSMQQAVDIVNKLLRHRHESHLAGVQLLRNTKTNVIEGLVKGQYKRLSNKVFHDQIEATLVAHGKPYRFHEALLNGRWLMLRYGRAGKSAELSGGDKFYSGYHFSNNEVGRACLHGGLFLLRDLDKTSSFDTSHTKLVHRGIAFEKRVSTLLAAVIREPNLDWLQGALERLIATPLRLEGSAVAREARMKAVASRLGKKLPSKCVAYASSMVGSAVSCGATSERIPLSLLSEKNWLDRSAFDLYIAIGREAAGLSISQREGAEQTAFGLLSGKWSLPSP